MHTGDFVMPTSVHHEEVCIRCTDMSKEGYLILYGLLAVKLLMDVL